jgi:hypothetical protein
MPKKIDPKEKESRIDKCLKVLECPKTEEEYLRMYLEGFTIEELENICKTEDHWLEMEKRK